ncbi:hypothetical protein EVAR_99655_1 [Eumeta japonica]|uniref:Peptidase C45 hydrolase domain-containing protein n=1 Tax=Eumeta variegata TaxID=151549 RepID=A0A4C1ZID8_EUMVA|nr:hypothetical protein EVAR_99655_1 [Eumeta japonica]
MIISSEERAHVILCLVNSEHRGYAVVHMQNSTALNDALIYAFEVKAVRQKHHIQGLRRVIAGEGWSSNPIQCKGKSSKLQQKWVRPFKGYTFGSLITSFIAGSEKLLDLERRADSAAGLGAYAATLENVSRRTPQYVSELHGVADGAGVPFRKLFLLHMDDIMETINDEAGLITPAAVGCTSIGVLRPGVALLGHTEDAFKETLNHWYILSAHIVPSEEERSQGAREERFTSLCYAGQLPGYTMGHTAAGMVFSINTLSPRRLRPGRTRVYRTLDLDQYELA